jgi:S-adenosylmethionine-diacylglycerol 3-amino-3-carboxypropyl transferase
MQALNPNLAHSAHELVNAPTLPLQAPIFARFDAAFWNGFNTWLVQQPLTLAMLGVPRPQIRIIERTFPGGITGFIRSKMEYVFTQLPMRDNYFWRVYATGQYSPTCCPNYLRPENFAALQQRADHLSTHTMTVAEFLRTNPGEYSHYVLLDHQDWLASHDTAGLREEWDLILANSRPGTRILMRSASPHIDFLPAAARARLHFFPEQAAALHNRDRVGTYGSTLLAEVL